MSKRTTHTHSYVSPLQPRLSQALTHLQPGPLECIFGTDPARLSLVHELLGPVAPLLILGDDAMGRTDLACSLLVQLLSMHGPNHLRLAILEHSPVIAPLAQRLPHLEISTWDIQTLMEALLRVAARVGASRPGSPTPAWVVVVNELYDFVQDTHSSKALSLRALIEHATEWGISLIALSRRGVPEINALFKSRIAFSLRELDWYSPLFEHPELLERLRTEQQQGQFLFARTGIESLLALPLLDVGGLIWQEEDGLSLLHREVGPVRCAALTRLLPLGGSAVTSLVGIAAVHIRHCVRCRHGLVAIPRALRKVNALDCEGCRQRFPTYYEATHPDHRLVEMPDRELLEVALHLGSCPVCSEQWSALVQISVDEEEGRC